MARRELTVAAAVAIFSSVLCGCAGPQSIRLQPSPPVATAEGQVTVRKDENKNTVLDVKVAKLVEPNRIAPDKAVYVVWADAPQVPPMNLGALRVNSDLSGELTAVTALPRMNIFITAESVGSVTEPSGERLLQTGLFDVKS